MQDDEEEREEAHRREEAAERREEKFMLSVTDIRDPYEVQTHLAPYASGTFDDFNEMVIQFGNLTPLPDIAEKSHA